MDIREDTTDRHTPPDFYRFCLSPGSTVSAPWSINIPPTKPGPGVERNEAVVAGHLYSGERLHLEMLDKPVQ